MFTIILEKGKDKIKEISAQGNEYYLCRDDERKYPLLSGLFVADIDTFSSSDMEGLIQELEEISKTLTKPEINHVNNLILLAKECSVNNKTTLSFNPFVR